MKKKEKSIQLWLERTSVLTFPLALPLRIPLPLDLMMVPTTLAWPAPRPLRRPLGPVVPLLRDVAPRVDLLFEAPDTFDLVVAAIEQGELHTLLRAANSPNITQQYSKLIYACLMHATMTM